MSERDATRIQLCGNFVARVAGRRIEQELPGRQGRLLLAYLAVNRDRVAGRDELADALWPRQLPSAPDLALSALLSKLRRLLPDGAIAGRSQIRLELGRDARVDVEAARNGMHRAEALAADGDWYAALGPTLVAYNISQRRLLPGEEGVWIDELRRELDEIHVRALECTARRCLALGGSEVAVAERSARRLIDLSPYGRAATPRSWRPSSGRATSPRASGSTSACAVCSATSLAPPHRGTCSEFTTGC